MNINEFAEYLAIKDTDKASELYDKLCCDVCCCDVDKYLNIIADDDILFLNEEYSYAELLEWLDADGSAYNHVNAVINSKYSSFEDLLEAGKHNQDKDDYDEVYAKLEIMLAEFNGDDELDDDDTPKTYESILDAL
jgi:hypothetical protein